MKFTDLEDKVLELVDEYVAKMEPVTGLDLGLDIRAGHNLLVNPEDGVIAVRKNNARMLEYYGGFEYVDSFFVTGFVDYLFYTGGARVEECLNYYKEKEIA